MLKYAALFCFAYFAVYGYCRASGMMVRTEHVLNLDLYGRYHMINAQGTTMSEQSALEVLYVPVVLFEEVLHNRILCKGRCLLN